jgi:hypothetical protein
MSILKPSLMMVINDCPFKFKINFIVNFISLFVKTKIISDEILRITLLRFFNSNNEQMILIKQPKIILFHHFVTVKKNNSHALFLSASN